MKYIRNQYENSNCWLNVAFFVAFTTNFRRICDFIEKPNKLLIKSLNKKYNHFLSCSISLLFSEWFHWSLLTKRFSFICNIIEICEWILVCHKKLFDFLSFCSAIMLFKMKMMIATTPQLPIQTPYTMDSGYDKNSRPSKKYSLIFACIGHFMLWKLNTHLNESLKHQYIEISERANFGACDIIATFTLIVFVWFKRFMEFIEIFIKRNSSKKIIKSIA